jgi:hypothetical protein
VGISSPLTSSAWWFGPTLGAQVTVLLWARLRVYAEAGISLSITRPVFEIEGFGEVHRTQGALGSAALGIEVPLW